MVLWINGLKLVREGAVQVIEYEGVALVGKQQGAGVVK
jgi:hypothetical protein